MSRKAVILLSGGLDSTTVAMFAAKRGFEIHALSFVYGQRHKIELEKAKLVAQHIPGIVEHKIFPLALDTIAKSALTSDIPVPKNQYVLEKQTIPSTYVPCRNIIFLSIAASYAETIEAHDIFIGANIIDYSNYPDCRPEFLQLMEKTINSGSATGTKGKKIKIHAPFLLISKAVIIKKGLELGVDYSKTISCYDPDSTGKSCGQCDACIIRKNAFLENDLKDPIDYI